MLFLFLYDLIAYDNILTDRFTFIWREGIIYMKRTLTIIALVLILSISILGYGIYWAFYDIQRIEGEKIIHEVPSPNGTYTVTAYLNNGGATTGYAVLCSVKANGQNKERNIYWQYRCEEADIVWVDEHTVQINGVELNVRKDTYDYRHN